MKKVLVFAMVAAVAAGAFSPVVADYYATKSDARQGKLTPGATPKAGTPNCTSPTVISDQGSMMFNDTGDTTGAANTVGTIPIGCNGNYTQVAGPDHIYTFTLGATNNLTFMLSTTSMDYDPSIYTLATCGVGTSCVAGAAADDCFATSQSQPPSCQGTDSTEMFNFMNLPAGTYFFFVDSFYSADNTAQSQGPYSLNVQGTFPVELMEFDVE